MPAATGAGVAAAGRERGVMDVHKIQSLDNRMKLYEALETKRSFLPRLPIVARLDGRCFHSFTKKLKRPYDKRLSELMIEITKVLVEESCARIGYTQSDEITLILYNDDPASQLFFGGKPLS